jgi:hypothetical protein
MKNQGWQKEGERHKLAGMGIHTAEQKQHAVSKVLKEGISIERFISDQKAKGYTEEEAKAMLSIAEKSGNITIKDNKIFLSAKNASKFKTDFVNSKV